MLHILLLILKIIGITLAVLLGLVLLLICIVLFVPVRYKGNGQKTAEEISGRVKVTWLFHLVTFTLTYEEGKISQMIRIFGINLQSLKKLLGRKSTIKTANDFNGKNEGKTVTEQSVQSQAEELENFNSDSDENDENNTSIWGRIRTFTKKIAAFVKKLYQKVLNFIRFVFQIPGKMIGLFQKIRLTFHNLCDKIKYWKNFLNDERTKAALVCVKDGAVRLFKHILPKKVKGEIHYGFEDPSTTGQVLGAVYMLYPSCQRHISIYPDFEHQILEGYLKLKGRICVCTLLWIALKIYFDKNFKTVLNILLHKEEL